jgi:hypothetical protein
MRQESDKLKLGKGASFFVKSRLQRLPQEGDTWEADFFPIPCTESEPDCAWWGIVLSHSHENVLAQRIVEEPLTVNDLATLLAEAMRRPLVDFSHRPGCIYLRARPEWAELLPHLKQVGIEVVSQEALPKWDRNFGDLYAQVEQARAPRKKKPMEGRQKPAAIRRPRRVGGDRAVFLQGRHSKERTSAWPGMKSHVLKAGMIQRGVQDRQLTRVSLCRANRRR